MDNPNVDPSGQAQPDAAYQKLAQAQYKLTLQARARSGIGWFYWIAGLSLINSIIFFFGGTTSFVVGLGATQYIDAIAYALASDRSAAGSLVVRLIGLGLSIGISLLFVTAGLLGRKSYRWAVIAGMGLYILDSLIFLLTRYWLGLGFHLFALWGLWNGLRAMNALQALDRAAPVTIPTAFSAISEPAAWYKSGLVRILGSMVLVYIGILVALAMVGFVLTR